MLRPLHSVCLALPLLTACSSSAHLMHRPDRVEAFCGDRATIATAIESIVASSGDVSAGAAPPPDRIRASVQHDGGVIAHWNSQPLYQPRLAKLLGVTDDYVTLGDAVISDAPRSGSRPIYLTVKTPTGPRTFGLRAYDVQDVCNEGKLSS